MIEKNRLRTLCDEFKTEHKVESVILLVKRKEMADLNKLCNDWDDVDVLPLGPKSEATEKDGQIHFCRPPAPEPPHPEDMPREDLMVQTIIRRLRCLKADRVVNTGEIKLHSKQLIPDENLKKLEGYFRELFDLDDALLVEEFLRYEDPAPSPS